MLVLLLTILSSVQLVHHCHNHVPFPKTACYQSSAFFPLGSSLWIQLYEYVVLEGDHRYQILWLSLALISMLSLFDVNMSLA